MKPVLWLASWYPSRVHPTNGDFVERHAKAVSALVPVLVLLVEKDEELPAGKTEVVVEEANNLTVYRAYYGKSGWGGVIEKLFSLYQYRKTQKKLYHQIVQKHGVPQLVHVHVAMKAGLLALQLKKRAGIPFVLTEHWTGYYRESVPGIRTIGPALRAFMTRVIKEASILFPVSRNLGETICLNIASVKYDVVSNVVDTSRFFYQPVATPVFRFIHPSYLNYQKNPEGMIEAAALVAARGHQFELLLLGNKSPHLEQLASSKNLLHKTVFIKDAVPYEEVAIQMQQSSALLLFSRFENLPCVVLEALCCGLPVISSDVGGINEVIDDRSGILVESNNVAALADAMEKMILGYQQYKREEIAAAAQRLFNYPHIARQYVAWYQKLGNR
jgi:glycosyltransferase involved in cell wall biosynthesis